MALVHWDGERWKPMTFKGAFHGADVYLCCPGPSLATLDPSLLQRPGIVTIAVNSAYPKVRPTLWVGTDHPTCFDQNFLWEPFIKVLRMCWRDQWVFGKPIKECPGVYFADVDDKSHALEMWDRQTDNLALVAPVRNSFEAALHLALWIGARRIHLVGCDFGGGKDYHDDRQLTDQQRVNNQRLYHELARRLIHHRVEGALRKIELISCTEGSPINSIMPHVPVEDAVAASAARVPTGWSPTPDARDATKCRWQGEVKAEQGVVVGVIEGQAWMLDWWYGNFRKHNPDLTVTFADFGLSKANQEWCDDHGGRVVVDCPEKVEGWFRKPFAILQAPYRKILWLDLDTEVRKPLAPFFDAITDDSLLICGSEEVCGPPYPTGHDLGWFLMLPDLKNDMCSGMVGVMRGNPHIQEWATNSVPPREFNYRGDQEILGVLIRRRQPKVHQVKGTEYTLSLFPASNDPIVLHHGGTTPKKLLRERIDRDRMTGGTGPTGHADGPIKDASQMFDWVEQREEKGIVTGVVPEQAFLVPWFLSNLKRHNPTLPLTIIDFTKLCVPAGVEGWFRKPFAVLQSPYRKTLWLDLDCEIRRSLDPIFGRIQAGRMSVCPTNVMCPPDYAKLRDRGWYETLPLGAVRFCGGLIGVEHGAPIIAEWAHASVPPREFDYRGDQEILSMVAHQTHATLDCVEAQVFSLSRAPGYADAVVLHHAGVPAKKRLQKLVCNAPPSHRSIQSLEGHTLMSEEELALILRTLDGIRATNPRPALLELGVCRGGTALAMMRHLVSRECQFDYVGVDAIPECKRFLDPAEFPDSNLSVLIGTTEAMSSDVRGIQPSGFDLVIVDACHCRDCVERDVDTYGTMVRVGGFLALHDSADAPRRSAEAQPGSPHRGVFVRDAYLKLRDDPRWDCVAEVIAGNGLAVLRRAPDAVA